MDLFWIYFGYILVIIWLYCGYILVIISKTRLFKHVSITEMHSKCTVIVVILYIAQIGHRSAGERMFYCLRFCRKCKSS